MNYVRGIGSTVLLGCLAVLTSPLQAQTEDRGFYATVYAQSSWLDSTTFDENGSARFGPGLKAEFDGGIGFGGDIGFLYGNGWAAEFEWNWRRHDLDSLRRGNTTLVTDGDFASNVLFVNGLRRFVRPSGGWVPYVGVGLNYTHYFINGVGPNYSGLKIKDSWGVAGQIGFDYMLDRHWGINFDVKKIMMEPHATVVLAGATDVTAKVKINPWIIGTGVTYRF